MGATRRAALLVLAAALLWAGIGPLAEPLLDRGWAPTAIAAWRAGIGGAAFLVHAALTDGWPRRSLPLLVAFGVFGVGVFYVALPAAIDTGGLTLAWLLLYTAPAWVALLAPRVLGQVADRRTLWLVGVTVGGVALVAVGGGEGVTVGVPSLSWGLLAGLAYASWYLVSQRAGTGPVATAAVALPVGAVVLAPFLRMPADSIEVALVVGLGIASTYLPVLAYWRGLQVLPAARAAVLATVEPVAALAVAALAFGERVGPVAAAGSALVLLAALAAARGPRATADGRDEAPAAAGVVAADRTSPPGAASG